MKTVSTWADLGGGLRVERTRPEHADGLEQLQRIVFPTLADDQRFKARHYRRHIELFGDGQFCVTDGDMVVGMTTTIRLDFDFEHPQHTFAAIIRGGWLTSYQPDGRWLYGADIGTHPSYRRRGIARALYAARHDTVRRLGLAGQVTVGMPSGYGAVKDTIRAEAYLDEVVSGRRTDPTLSAQMRIGFVVRNLLPAYIDDPVSGGYGVVMVLAADHVVPMRRVP